MTPDITAYILFGILFNAIYDLTVTRIKEEHLRFTVLERILVLIIWPIPAILFFGGIIRGFLKDK
jgi:hypothetical protein